MKHIKFSHLPVLALICTLLLIPAVSFAGGKVDFSGKWSLNQSKSDLGEGRFFSAMKMVVKQEGNNITIERTRSGRDGQERTSSETLTMDDKEIINRRENRSTTSTATWSDDGTTLTIKSKMEFNRQGETFERNSTDVWILDEDGRILRIQSDSSSSRGERSVTLVYDKE